MIILLMFGPCHGKTITLDLRPGQDRINVPSSEPPSFERMRDDDPIGNIRATRLNVHQYSRYEVYSSDLGEDCALFMHDCHCDQTFVKVVQPDESRAQPRFDDFRYEPADRYGNPRRPMPPPKPPRGKPMPSRDPEVSRRIREALKDFAVQGDMYADSATAAYRSYLDSLKAPLRPDHDTPRPIPKQDMTPEDD